VPPPPSPQVNAKLDGCNVRLAETIGQVAPPIGPRPFMIFGVRWGRLATPLASLPSHMHVTAVDTSNMGVASSCRAGRGILLLGHSGRASVLLPQPTLWSCVPLCSSPGRPCARLPHIPQSCPCPHGTPCWLSCLRLQPCMLSRLAHSHSSFNAGCAGRRDSPCGRRGDAVHCGRRACRSNRRLHL
jgi:hypothetical protein